MTTVLPMFPLGTVLVPGELLPLHVFEPRYRALVRACLEPGNDPEFGVTLIERGSEVGGGDRRFTVGCVARILEIVELEDGRFAIGTVGTRRIRVERWLPEELYPRAEILDWPDPTPTSASIGRRDQLVRPMRHLLAMATEAGLSAGPATVDVASDPLDASYQMASLLPLTPLDRLALLSAPSVEERFELLDRQIADLREMLAARLSGG